MAQFISFTPQKRCPFHDTITRVFSAIALIIKIDFADIQVVC
jgi:hypothetical protein